MYAIMYGLRRYQPTERKKHKCDGTTQRQRVLVVLKQPANEALNQHSSSQQSGAVRFVVVSPPF